MVQSRRARILGQEGQEGSKVLWCGGGVVVWWCGVWWWWCCGVVLWFVMNRLLEPFRGSTVGNIPPRRYHEFVTTNQPTIATMTEAESTFANVEQAPIDPILGVS